MSIDISNVSSQITSASQMKTKQKTTAKSAQESTSLTSTGTEAAVYTKSEGTEKKVNYSINQKNAADREAIVAQMKQELANRQKQLTDLVSKMLGKQAGTQKLADLFNTDENSGIKLADVFSEVNLKNASLEDIKQAKEDVSEDGYWGVKQTSQRLFDFASALAGDDTEKMKKMQAAMEKGFQLATKAWGKELPSISKDTLEAANKLFDDYYASKGE